MFTSESRRNFLLEIINNYTHGLIKRTEITDAEKKCFDKLSTLLRDANQFRPTLDRGEWNALSQNMAKDSWISRFIARVEEFAAYEDESVSHQVLKMYAIIAERISQKIYLL
jgi:hypothetical protein